MKTRYTRVELLPRNDIEAALECRRYLKSKGKWSPENAHILLKLQDDPTELLAAIRREA